MVWIYIYIYTWHIRHIEWCNILDVSRTHSRAQKIYASTLDLTMPPGRERAPSSKAKEKQVPWPHGTAEEDLPWFTYITL